MSHALGANQELRLHHGTLKKFCCQQYLDLIKIMLELNTQGLQEQWDKTNQ